MGGWKTPVKSLLNFKVFGFFTVGCICAAVTFLAYIFLQSTPTEVFENLLAALSTTDHLGESFFDILVTYFMWILSGNRYALLALKCATVLLAVIIIDKGREKRQGLYFLIALLITLLYLVPFIMDRAKINTYMFPLNILAFFCFVLSPKKNARAFGFFWITGMIYAFCMDYASNQQFLAIADATFVSTLGSILIIVSYIWDKSRNYRFSTLKIICKASTVCLLMLFVLSVVSARYGKVYFETDGLANKTEVISVGVEKGIHTTAELKQVYEKSYYDAKDVRDYKGDSVLYYTSDAWLYLDDTKRNASYSSWLPIETESTSDTLIKYYEMNPLQLPDIVYLNDKNKDYNDEIMAFFIEKQGYQKVQIDAGCILLQNDVD